MSNIKRLKLKGFKSFANPTIINFETGFNTIVGANGSGKSNVFDALCFVLGRMSSKGLRADKLGNLVFNGGKNLKPVKEAEVSIYLSNEKKELLNAELDEIKISRVVKNSGQSKYLLNNQVVTRTEVVDILKMAHIDPDGYNIILQGDIMKIVNMSPNERRALIEEIADISGYEEQRQKSLKKLEKVDLELNDADLLMAEKTKYLRELKSEKEQAVKYHKVADDLRFNSLLLIKSKILRNKSLISKKKEDIISNEEIIGTHKEKLDVFESKRGEIEEQICQIEKEIEIKSHNDFISVTNLITSLEGKAQFLSEKKAEFQKQEEEISSKSISIKADIIKNQETRNDFNKKIIENEKLKNELISQIEILNKEITNLKKGVSSKNFDNLNEIDSLIEELLEKKQNKTLIYQDNFVQTEKLNTKLELLQKSLEEIEMNNSTNKDQFKELNNFRKKQKELIIEISTKANKNSEVSAKIANLNREYSSLNEKYSSLKMKSETSKDFISTNRAVDTISKLSSKDSSIFGTLSSLASVNSKYSLALETAAGKSLFNIVVENDSCAVKYINYLKENRIGNATFLPLNKIKAKANLNNAILNKPGVIDYALNLVSYNTRFDSIFNLIFSDTLVIDKIESAKGIGIGQFRMVTLEGDLVSKSGAMSGGFKSRKKGLGAFADEGISEKLGEVELKVSQLKGTLDYLNSEKQDLEREIYDLRYEKQEIEGEVSKLEKVLSIGGQNCDSIKSEIENILSDKAVIDGSLMKIKKEIEVLEDELSKQGSNKAKLKESGSDSAGIMSKIILTEEKRDKLKNRLIGLNTQIESANIQIKNVLEPENQTLNKIVIDSKKALEKIYLELKSLTYEIKNLNLEIKENKKKEKELSKDYKQFISKRDDLKEEKLKVEAKYEKEYEKFDKVKEKGAQIRYAISEFETLSKNLLDELENVYRFIKSEFVKTDENGNTTGEEKVEELINQIEEKLKNSVIDVKELQNKVNNLKSKLNSFGSINMKAVEIYDKLKEEFDLLLAKREILNIEKSGILTFVSEMDGLKKIKFLETFVVLKENFIKTFNLLSTKGEVELNIEDEKDLFNSGVNIRVRLSKNNYLDTKSLSGGEKTITAVAFIFAIQKFNPASFYIFDEIDAALDIMNCENLGKLIKSSAHKAQYIVVSHSEHFIQSADTIYGVTMDKNKISGVVSLDLANMGEYVDEE